jgi:hypothetical protein
MPSNTHLPANPSFRRPALALLFLAALTGGSCAQTSRPPSVLSAWRDEQARFFDDGIDFETGRVVRLRGKWSTSEDELFQGRLGYADVVAVGKVQLVTAESRGEQVRGYRLAFMVEDLLKGDFGGFADEQLLSVGVSPGADGFRLLTERAKDLVGSKAVLYVKWQNPKDRTYRFHLSDAVARPPSELRAMLLRLKSGK